MKRVIAGVESTQLVNMFTYLLIPTVLLTLIVAINFHYINDYQFLSGLGLVGLFFITLLPGKNKHKKEDEFIEIQEKLIKAQEEVKKLKQENQQLLAQDKAKDKFLKILAHDIKSPVNSILGINEVLNLNEVGSKEELLFLIEKVMRASENVKMLVDNLMQWYVASQGQLDPTAEKVWVMEVVEKVMVLYQKLADEKQITLKNDVPHDLYIKADKHHLFTILRNIVNNAIKFTDNGGNVEITAKREGDRVGICIEDDGKGISDNVLEVIGERNKSDVAVMESLVGTKGEIGNGLGLCICTELIEINKGIVEINSQIEKGTSFTVSLPAY